MEPLLVEKCCFLSLQKGFASVAAYEFPNIQHLPLTDSFADTAAFLQNIDLLITVDTAICHVAGGLGVPVWLLNRYDSCWRWLRNRTDSPWYPSMRIFRQDGPGDWGSVIDKIKAVLERL